MSTAAKKTRRIETFRPGKHTSSQGVELEFTAEQLQDLATVYDPVNAPAPIVLGHPAMDAPAFGWASGFTYDADRERLDADLGDDLDPLFAAAVEAKKFRKVSLALFPPTHSANPKPGHWYPRHIGFLGAAAPAVTGLKPVTFTDGQPFHFQAGTDRDLVEVEFACSAQGWAVRDAFGRIRDFFIDKFGLEVADKALPAYLVESVNPPEQHAYGAPGAPAKPTPAEAPATTTEEVTMSTPTPKTPAELQAENERLTAANAALTAAAAKAARDRASTDAASFCAQLVTERKLRPADVDALSAALAPAFMAEPVTFGAGDAAKTESPAAVIRRVLGAAATIIDTREKSADTGTQRERGGLPSFAAPSGVEVNADQDRIHRKAKELQAANANLSFADAVSQAQLALQAG